jgi:hypothetical protein
MGSGARSAVISGDFSFRPVALAFSITNLQASSTRLHTPRLPRAAHLLRSSSPLASAAAKSCSARSACSWRRWPLTPLHPPPVQLWVGRLTPAGWSAAAVLRQIIASFALAELAVLQCVDELGLAHQAGRTQAGEPVLNPRAMEAAEPARGPRGETTWT